MVAVIATRSAAAAGWAPSVVLDLARAWAAEGGRVIVVDGVVERPTLHEAADAGNREGLVDAVLHGASVGRVSHQVAGEGLFVIPAGSPVASADTVAADGRWQRLASAMTEAGVAVLLYLEDEQESASAFLDHARDVVVLCGPDEAVPPWIRESGIRIRAVTGPEDPSAVAPLGVASAPTSLPPREPRIVEKRPGGGRLLLLLIGALIIAAGLGYLLTSLL
ncbi:MAG: hypothetical protein R3304_04225 [Longimicrobiales bacterium]|nr:hypothetical protein [Longimicrobiales bacterium]